MFEKKAPAQEVRKPVGKLQTPSIFGAKKEDPPVVKKSTEHPPESKKDVSSLTAMFEKKSTVKLDQDKKKFLDKNADS